MQNSIWSTTEVRTWSPIKRPYRIYTDVYAPEVSWKYGWEPENSDEENLYKNYLSPKNWLEIE